MPTANSKVAKYTLADLQSALEAEMELRAEAEKALRRTREEFEEFILTAAHDLKEPLRTVNAYCELVARKDPGRSDAETDQFRRYILEGTVRIQSLVAGMVECATAETASRYLLSVDMNSVFSDARSLVTAQTGLPKMVIEADALPVVKGEFEKLVKVMRHLLDNAARYSDQAEAHIRVSARRENCEWMISVQDNGPGIEATYFDRIFEPFKRLHGRQYTGSGLGLAFCRKAIQAHGGRLWVESTEGAGATFYFSLPASE